MNVGRSGQWRPSVLPFLELLAERLEGTGKSDHTVSVDIEGLRLLVTPLEQELVHAIGGDGDITFARRQVLVRDSLGLRIKLLLTLQKLESCDPEDREKLLETINSDVGLGCQLMHEITLEMKQVTAAGDIDEARDFSQYRQQLSRVVTEAEREVHNSGTVEVVGRRNNTYASKRGGAGGRMQAPASTTDEDDSRRSGLIVLAVVLAATVVAVVAWYFFF